MIKFPSQYLNFTDTLECGQVFRFTRSDGGYYVYSLDKCAYVENNGDLALIDGDESFSDYFDLALDYSAICARARSYGIQKLTSAVDRHEGLRILRQDRFEALCSFIISQNNNIPRIKSTIEKLCAAFGEEKNFNGKSYHAFPTAEALACASTDTLRSLGLGYRDEYVKGFAEAVASGALSLSALENLSTKDLRDTLVSVKGVGNKVADCALLFGFGRTDAFPVDTWIEKLYKEDFHGELSSRKKIAEFFTSLFGYDSGYVQQYLFYAKRESEF